MRMSGQTQMNLIQRCAECQRLWRKYSITMVEHIKLEDKLQVAAAARESTRVTELKVLVESAAQQRTHARQAISHHEQEAHGARGAKEHSRAMLAA